LGLCGDDEDKCTKLEKQIEVRIFSRVFVANEVLYLGSYKACEYEYSLDFYKEHCGGDLGYTMSYSYEGCGQRTEDYTTINWVPVGFWEVTFTYEKDMFNVNFVDPRFNGKITRGSISGREIYELTDGGFNKFIIEVVIRENVVEIDWLSELPI
jgi:hypothetical protein